MTFILLPQSSGGDASEEAPLELPEALDSFIWAVIKLQQQ